MPFKILDSLHLHDISMLTIALRQMIEEFPHTSNDTAIGIQSIPTQDTHWRQDNKVCIDS